MVREKGKNPFAIAMISREVELTGYNRLILKTDQEPAILDLMAMVKRERPEDVEIISEQSPVGEHQSNGDVERAAQTIEGQIRRMLFGLEGRYKSRIREDHGT